MTNHLKKIGIVAIAMTGLSLASFTVKEIDAAGVGRVQKLSGKEIYIMSEPLTPYTTVGNVGWGEIVTSGSKMTDVMPAFVKRASKKFGEESYDALISVDGHSATAIKFK